MKSNKGSAEIIAFILVLPLLLVPVFNNIHVYMDMHRYSVLKQAAREALLMMEIQGGLKSQDYDRLVNYLDEKNFDSSKIHMDYTPYPVEFGEEVAFRISYEYTQVRYTLGVTGIRKIAEVKTMAYGPVKSTSKHYER